MARNLTNSKTTNITAPEINKFSYLPSIAMSGCRDIYLIFYYLDEKINRT